MLSKNITKLVKLAAVLALLSTASFGAMAEWTEVGEGTEMKAYADINTIRRSGHMVKMWSLFDLKSPNPSLNGTYSSARIRYEYDCSDERTRRLDYIAHSERMTGGFVVASDSTPGKWSSVSPGSFDETYFKIACGKK